MGAGAALAVVGGGATDAAPSVAAGTDGDGTPVVDCESRSQIIPPRDPSRKIDRRLRKVSKRAGPAWFLGAKTWRRHPRENLEPKRPGGMRGVKIPITLRANREITVTAIAPEGREAFVVVGRDQGANAKAESVTLRACPKKAKVAGRHVGPWTPFPAGFRVDGPMCLRVEVAVTGRSEPIWRNLRLGKRTKSTCPPKA